MLKLIYIFVHVLIVNSRCYLKKLISPSTFFKFHSHLDENSVRSAVRQAPLSCRLEAYTEEVLCKLGEVWHRPGVGQSML